MMTKRFSALILIMLLCGGGLLFPLFGENGKWVIAAKKFTLDNGNAKDPVNEKTGELIPSDILEKLGYSVIRNVLPDEQFERTKYKLRTERQSLFLQLSAEYKKRDSLVLSNASDLKLKSALSDSQKKIKDIQKKIDANLVKLKTASEENERKMSEIAAGRLENENPDTELERYRKLFRNIFVRDESLIQQEQITFYNDDYTMLYNSSGEKNIVSAGINALLTGHFSKYGDYISIYVDIYSYPGEIKIGSASDVGSVQELELITNNIAMQIVPLITNSFPVELEVAINPADAAANTVIYLDGDLQNTDNGKIIVGSGIHNIQFIADGYKTAGTTYAFEGNKKYKIDVNYERPQIGFLQVGLKNPLEGEFLMNGERAQKISNRKSQISINGKEILGEFIAENGETAFFYIPKNLVYDGSFVTINPKPMDRMAYIDKRRKIMYASYSIFILSLIPTFYTYGNYVNYANMYKNNQIDYKTAKSWENATNATRFITIGCGVFWGYELVRYLIAANSVLPQNAKQGDLTKFKYYEPDEVPADDNDKKDENIEENDGDKK